MKICYIAHPISGDIESNLADIRRIVKHINLNFPNVIPFVPYYVDVVSLDDTIKEQRERGISNNIAILKSGMVDALWLTGDTISNGMRQEIDIAIENNIPIIELIGKI